MSLLEVRFDGRVVAHLDDVAGGGMASLTYTAAAVEQFGTGSVLLSVRLPVRPEPYPGVETRYWLEGVLPEDHVRAQLAVRAGIDAGDVVGLLRHYGRECAGAVSFVPVPDGPPQPSADPFDSDEPQVKWLSDAELDDAVRALPRAPLGVDVDNRVRISLGGLQDKLVVVADADRFGLPLGATPSTHILKPAPVGADGRELWPGIVTAEAYGLRVCAALDIPVPELRILHLAGRPALLVRRYDRSLEPDGSIRRLHQEDLCQALGLATANKYQTLGDTPSLRHLAGLLDAYAAAPAVELLGLLRRMLASLVVGNCDHHAKNWSMTLEDGVVRLTPAYDVVPTRAWDDLTTRLGLRVGAASSHEGVRRDDVLSEADSWGLGSRATQRELARVGDSMPSAAQAAAADTRAMGGDAGLLDRLVDMTTRFTTAVLS